MIKMIHVFEFYQDDLPQFNIHHYGDQLLLQFKDVGQTKSFSECVQKSPSSICRSFAATLQLVSHFCYSVTKYFNSVRPIET